MHEPALWTADEAAHATGGVCNGSWTATGVSIDSRTIIPGDLFVALSGPSFDGHDFVGEAVERGAAAAVVSRLPEGLSANAPLLKVGDTQGALEALAREARNRTAAKIIAVTGSVGKTGTKEALKLALGALGRTHTTQGNLNNNIGTPLSLARMPAHADFGVFELGMSHAGEIRALSRLVRPDVAIVTTIAAAHLEFFESIAAIAEAKAEIFEGMSPAGVAILNRDNAYYALLVTAAWSAGIGSAIGFGADPDAEARLLNCQLRENGSSVKALVNGATISYDLPVAGRHWALNTLAVLAAVDALGGAVATAAQAFAGLTAPKGRGASQQILLPRGEIELIDDSYNAGPASMRAAIAVLKGKRPGRGGRRIAVLGDMLELGPSSEMMHAALARDLKSAGIDLVYLAGEKMAALDATLPSSMRGGYARTSQELRSLVVDALHEGDVVLVKGSLGSRMGLIADAISKIRPAAPPPRTAVCL